jgi:hypothetical protein
MEVLKQPLHGHVQLQEVGNTLQGLLKPNGAAGEATGPMITVVPAGFQVTQKKAAEAAAPTGGFFRRLLKPNAPKAAPSAPASEKVGIPLGTLSEVFRENDQVDLVYGGPGQPITLICHRNNQLGFALGQLSSFLPLRGAANMIFESLTEEPAPKTAWTLVTSLRPLELKPGKTVGLGYYAITLWKRNFCSILRTDISVRTEDIKALASRS